jgi:very-short-patch-repair endonuclease
VGVRAVSRFDHNAAKTALARRLRRASTNVEMQVWQKLRNRQLGVDFRRQHPVGRYVLDLYCPALHLAIEIDGGQHSVGKNIARDAERTSWLAAKGVAMLRFWNSDVAENLPGVLETIAAKISELKSTSTTPTRRWRADLPLSGGGRTSPPRC